nr:carboxypeptidase-like regulatory domain-containing protein [uncultured Allomuricauda sp.]
MTTRKFKTSKNRNYFSIIGMIFACGVLVTSCNDELDTEQFLNRQQQRADDLAQQEADAEAAQEAANAAALAAAQLLDYTLTLHSDDVPAEGVAVNLTNNAGTTASVTTDSSGNAIFTGLAMGGHTVSISSSDYLDASYNVDFGTPVQGTHYEIIDGKVYSLGTNAESSKVELYNLSAMQMATLTGKVEIETDLTNNDPEVPQDITIRANLDGLTPANSHSFIDEAYNQNNTSIYVSGSFTFTEGDIGVATVDNTTGEYTMQVPATDDGTDIQLLFPLVETEQTLGWEYENGEYVGPQVGPQAAAFGPDIVATTTPSVAGVVAEFTAPPEPGRGFALGNFQPIPRGLTNGIIDDFPIEDDLNRLRFRGNPGSADFQLSPIITVSDPDINTGFGHTARLVAEMVWTLESFDVTGGSNFNGGEFVDLSVEVTYSDATTERFDTGLNQQAGFGGDLLADSYTNVGFTFGTTKEVTNITISQGEFDSPNGIVNSVNIVINGSITSFAIDVSGLGYTSIPTITIGDEGSPTTPASLEITDMAFRHSYELDNSGVTQAYVVLPQIMFEYEDAPGSTMTTSNAYLPYLYGDGFILGSVQVKDSNGVAAPLQEALGVSGNSLVFDSDAYFEAFGTMDIEKGMVVESSFSTPRAIVIEPTHSQTTADVDVNADGEIIGLSNISHGKGYNTTYDVQFTTLDGLPGSGAALELVGFSTINERTGELTWSENFIITDGGSGYTLDVNIPEEPFTPGTASQVITVKNGETKIVNVNYGTGKPVAELE